MASPQRTTGNGLFPRYFIDQGLSLGEVAGYSNTPKCESPPMADLEKDRKIVQDAGWVAGCFFVVVFILAIAIAVGLATYFGVTG